MCGILGLVNHKNDRPLTVVRKMGLWQIHRGPDGWGEFLDDHVCFGHNRLAILDIRCGQQPMCSEDDNEVVVFNGEIYNFMELRRSLEQKGYKFKTDHSDTETILVGYRHYGEKIFEKLDGMFAIAIYDKRGKKVVLARDRIGIKPLYYSITKNNELVFSSEMRPIVKSGKVNLVLNNASIVEYVHNRSSLNPDTLLKDIRKLPPGFFLSFSIEDSSHFLSQYFDVSQILQKELENASEKLEDLLSRSVQSHLISDVPIGLYLSGGVDSSLISYFTRKFTKLTAFTVGTESIHDESKYARAVADHLGIDLFIQKVAGSEFVKKFDYWMYVNDDPVSDPSALALMLLSEIGQNKGYKVMLSGEGADELFGGYFSYIKFLFFLKFRGKKIIGRPINYALARKFPKLSDYDQSNDFLGTAHLSSSTEKLQIFVPEFHEYIPAFLKKFHAVNYENEKKQTLRRATIVDQKYRLPDDILSRTDRATMAFSIESRVPFLSNKLIDYANSLHDSECVDLYALNGKKILKKLTWKN